MSSGAADAGLTVTLDGSTARRLVPGRRVTFGRAAATPTHLHLGDGDRCVSRITGEIRWRGGTWGVRNRSWTLPFDVVVGHTVVSVRPRGWWPVGSDDVVVRLATPTGGYEIGLHPDPRVETDPEFVVGLGSITAPPLDDRPSAHDRLLLAAKFLSRYRDGDAIGDRLAAERATLVRGSTVTAKAVENCVRRWRTNLKAAGARDVDGRSKIDRVGRLLLDYGVLCVEDRLHLPPVPDAVD